MIPAANDNCHLAPFQRAIMILRLVSQIAFWIVIAFCATRGLALVIERVGL